MSSPGRTSSRWFLSANFWYIQGAEAHPIKRSQKSQECPAKSIQWGANSILIEWRRYDGPSDGSDLLSQTLISMRVRYLHLDEQ